MTIEDMIIERMLDKVELAARRAVDVKYPNGSIDSLMQEFAEQIKRISKDLRNGQ